MRENGHQSVRHNVGKQQMAAASLAMHWGLWGSVSLSFLNTWGVLGPRNSIHLGGMLAKENCSVSTHFVETAGWWGQLRLLIYAVRGSQPVSPLVTAQSSKDFWKRNDEYSCSHHLPEAPLSASPSALSSILQPLESQPLFSLELIK